MAGISERAQSVPGMALARLLGVPGVIDIALGIPQDEPPESTLRGAVTALRSGRNQYADPAGLAELRRAWAARLTRTRGVAVDPAEHLTVTCGATEGVFAALLTTTDPGDEVLVPEPFFENYPGMVTLAGCRPVVVPLRQPEWSVDLTAVRAAVTPRTRALLLNTPHNPTGRVLAGTELRGLLDICREHQLTCITDEVYESFVFDGRELESPLGAAMLAGGPAAPHCVVVTSLSKTLAMTGWRLGVCVAPPATTAALRRVHERITVGAAAPLQHGAAALAPTEDDLDRRRRVFGEQRDRMVDALTAAGFQVRRPEGGWFLLAGVDAFGRPASELAKALAVGGGVLVAPGAPFFATAAEGDRWLRMTFVRDPAATAEALTRLRRHLGQR